MNLNLDEELCDWQTLFANNDNYKKLILKGGSVLGLYVLKTIVTHTNNPDILVKFYRENLIKDWDFTLYGANDLHLTEKFRQEGIKIKVIRHVHKTMINDEALIELAVHSKLSLLADLSDVELPMTLAHVVFNDVRDVSCILNFIKMWNGLTLDTVASKYDEISTFVKCLNIVVVECSGNGLADVNCYSECVHYGPFVNHTKLFDSFACSIDEKQFLISHFSQLDRLLVRLFCKNIPKAEKINNFLRANNINESIPILSIDKEYCLKIVTLFVDHLCTSLIKDELDALSSSKQIDLGVFITLQNYYAKCLASDQKYGMYKKTILPNVNCLDQISKVMSLDSKTINTVGNICDGQIMDKIFKLVISKDKNFGIDLINFFDRCNLVRAHIMLKKNPEQMVYARHIFQSFIAIGDKHKVNIYNHVQPKSIFSRFMYDVYYPIKSPHQNS